MGNVRKTCPQRPPWRQPSARHGVAPSQALPPAPLCRRTPRCRALSARPSLPRREPSSGLTGDGRQRMPPQPAPPWPPRPAPPPSPRTLFLLLCLRRCRLAGPLEAATGAVSVGCSPPPPPPPPPRPPPGPPGPKSSGGRGKRPWRRRSPPARRRPREKQRRSPACTREERAPGARAQGGGGGGRVAQMASWRKERTRAPYAHAHAMRSAPCPPRGPRCCPCDTHACFSARAAPQCAMRAWGRLLHPREGGSVHGPAVRPAGTQAALRARAAAGGARAAASRQKAQALESSGAVAAGEPVLVAVRRFKVSGLDGRALGPVVPGHHLARKKEKKTKTIERGYGRTKGGFSACAPKHWAVLLQRRGGAKHGEVAHKKRAPCPPEPRALRR